MADESRYGARIAAFVLTSIAGAEALGVLALRVFVVPVFMEMFADFGGALPVVTMLVMGWAWPLLWVAAIMGLVGAATVAPVPTSARLAMLVLAVLTGLVAIAGTIGALYLPMFAIAPQLE